MGGFEDANEYYNYKMATGSESGGRPSRSSGGSGCGCAGAVAVFLLLCGIVFLFLR